MTLSARASSRSSPARRRRHGLLGGRQRPPRLLLPLVDRGAERGGSHPDRRRRPSRPSRRAGARPIVTSRSARDERPGPLPDAGSLQHERRPVATRIRRRRGGWPGGRRRAPRRGGRPARGRRRARSTYGSASVGSIPSRRRPASSARPIEDGGVVVGVGGPGAVGRRRREAPGPLAVPALPEVERASWSATASTPVAGEPLDRLAQPGGGARGGGGTGARCRRRRAPRPGGTGRRRRRRSSRNRVELGEGAVVHHQAVLARSDPPRSAG